MLTQRSGLGVALGGVHPWGSATLRSYAPWARPTLKRKPKHWFFPALPASCGGARSLVQRPLLGRPAHRCPVVTLVTACRPPGMQMWHLLLPRSQVTVWRLSQVGSTHGVACCQVPERGVRRWGTRQDSLRRDGRSSRPHRPACVSLWKYFLRTPLLLFGSFGECPFPCPQKGQGLLLLLWPSGAGRGPPVPLDPWTTPLPPHCTSWRGPAGGL